MRSLLISIQPKLCELIANGTKTIEVRKTRPKLETPFKCYMYQTRHGWIYKLLKKLGLYQGKVVGEFVCDRIDEYNYRLTTFAQTHYRGKYISQKELTKTCFQ